MAKKKKLIISLFCLAAVVAAGICAAALIGNKSGITDEGIARQLEDIDFTTETIMDEDVPLGSSVNNPDAREMAELKAMSQEILNLVNQNRANAGLNALTWDTDLELAAAVRAAESSSRFAHTRPDGSQWYTVNPRIMHGENLAYGFKTAASAVNAWMNSPSHRQNILYPDFTRCSVAIYKTGGTYYIAQEFRFW